MFETLRGAIEAVGGPVDEAELVELHALTDALAARVAAADAAFAEAGGWQAGGFASMAQWLRLRAGMGRRAATRQATTARRLSAWPTVAAAWRQGRLAGGQVDALVAVVPDRHVERFAEGEADLVAALEHLDVIDTVAVARTWVRHADAADPDEGDTSGRGSVGRLHASRTLGGVGVLDGELDAGAYSVVEAALRVARRDDPCPDGRPRPVSERNADALVDISRFFLDHTHTATSPGRQRPHVNLVCDLADLHTAAATSARPGLFDSAQVPALQAALAATGSPAARAATLDGAEVPVAFAHELACDAVLHRVLVAGPVIVDHGRAVRVVTDTQRAALAVRDRGCRHPGCDRPPGWCHAHHLVPWELGGPTDLANLVLVCNRHHRLWHHPRWTVTLHPDTTLTVTAPDGTTHTSPPPRTHHPQPPPDSS